MDNILAGGKEADAHVGDEDLGTDILGSDDDKDEVHNEVIDNVVSGNSRKLKDKGIIKSIKNQQLIVYPWKCLITNMNKVTAIVNLPSGVQELDV